MVKRLSTEQIVRMPSIEKKYGIDELKVFAYLSGKELTVVGEVIADEITEDFSLTCSVYDADGDMVESIDNNSYGSGLVTHNIKCKTFFNGYPFKFHEYLDDGVDVSKIRIIPN